MLLTDIGALAVVAPGPHRGGAMRHVRMLPDAALLMRAGKIAWYGPRGDAPSAERQEQMSAGGGLVTPALIDCHTHIPFAGDRAGEFVRRAAGESYLAIMQSGGGICVTTTAVRAAEEDALVRENLPRLARMLAGGVTTVECKSGYGLSLDDERKQLRAIRTMRGLQAVELVPTYMGAHAVPAEFDGHADAFLDSICSDAALRQIATEGLAEFCDIFCDRGAFDVDQARRVLRRAAAAGLRLKLHADELAAIGASALAGELGAVSADHLEHLDDSGLAAMRAAGTVAVVLPGTSFFLGIPHADARRMITEGLAVALATDCNPGSCMIESLPLVMNVACCQLRMTPEEVLTACTANAAAAIGRQDRLGAIAVGHDADLLIVDARSLAHWFYRVGCSAVRAVLKRGRVVYAR
ncbi:MAG: Imidazolonepropionase [Phycisphaerae bacterium]|nr:Imidazolonepropionase [Phycisphaerae bacterium]